MMVRQEGTARYFKFLHCWAEHQHFMDILKDCWTREATGNPMWILHQKMKRLSTTLITWSKKEYGDVFATVKDYEERVRNAEEEVINNNSEHSRSNLHCVNAEYIRYLRLEESILKQKTQLQWFREGDANSKYFHALMRGRRRRLHIHKICKENEEWVQGD